MPQIQSNCVICLLRPMLVFGSVVVSLFTFNCPHEATKFHAKYSRILGIISTITCIYCILAFAASIKYFHQNMSNIVELLFVINAMIAFMRIVNLTFFAHYRAGFKMAEVRGLVAILSKKDEYEIDSFLTVDIILKYRRYTMICLTVVCLVELNVMGYMLIVKHEAYVVLQALINGICSFIHAIAVLHYILFVFLYIHLFKVCFGKIQEELSDVKAKICFINIYDSANTVILRKLSGLYLKLCKTFLLGNKNNQEIVTVSFVNYVAMFINSSFLQYINAFHDISIERVVLMQAQAILSVAVITHYLFVHERLSNIGDDLISVLFKFPFNSLSQRSAHQMESILALLITKKPVFQPLNMFRMGSSLVPSILGMTTTYLLVAMQFYVSSIKREQF